MGEFCFSEKETHEDCESGMCRNGCKHPQYTRSQAVLIDVQYIFQSGEAHAHHNRVDDAIKRFVKVFIVKQDEAHKKEFAEFLHQRNLEEGIEKLVGDVVFLR